MFDNSDFFMGGMHGLWWIFWIVLFGVLVYYAVTQWGQKAHRPRETALEVLQRRLASGEITPDEFQERKVLLERGA